MRYVIGLDIGSSAAKAGLFSLAGQAVAVAGRGYPTDEPKPGYREQDPEQWWSACVAAIREVACVAPGDEIVALGATGHISSFTFVDAAGTPLRPSIGFQDRRALAEVDELYRIFTRKELANLLGIDLPPGATWPLPKLIWLRKNEPETLEKSRWLLQAKDFINLRLTGNCSGDASSNRGMVDLRTSEPAKAVFEKLHLPDLLPSILPPHAVMGHVTARASADTGLPVGLPVVAGWNDLNAGALGSGAVHDGDGFNITGTSEHIGVVLSRREVSPELICAPFLPGRDLIYGVTTCGGGSLDWYARMSGRTVEELLAQCGQSEPCGSPLIFLPYLEGERSPIWDPRASGAFVGLRSVHVQADLVRAVLEGVGFSLRQILERVERCAGAAREPIVVSGGASRLHMWNQIKADILERSICTRETPHAGVLGAAILAAVAAGAYPDCESASTSMVHTQEQYQSRPAAYTRYRALYRAYEQLYPRLRPVLHGLHDDFRSIQPHMSQKHAVIFGAGKIARGFIAHLLVLSGYRITFVEKSAELVAMLRERRRYKVHIMGAPEKSVVIKDFEVIFPGEQEKVAEAIASASVIFVSIGGPNLPQIAPLLAAGLARRTSSINIILGENYFHPAMLLRQATAGCLAPDRQEWFSHDVGIVETMILRSTIEPTEALKSEDPLALQAQDLWEIPADKEAFVGEIPEIQGLVPKQNFQAGLLRKLFTYNAINAVIAYSGYLKGYYLLSEAANDPEILELAHAAACESADALCRQYGFDAEEQRRFTEAAIAKYRKQEIVDPIERNTRDPLRKLARHDRLVGPACLAIEHGIRPAALSRGIAAALHYDLPGDPAAQKLQALIREKGVARTIQEVCGIDPASELAALVLSAYPQLEKTCAGAIS